MTTTLPPKRVVQSRYRQADVPEDYAEEIQDAINRGTQLVSNVKRELDFHGSSPESCLTRFTDPRAGEERWAVEVWAGKGKWTRDFGDEQLATAYQLHENNRLGI